jgi:hypothetical protein
MTYPIFLDRVRSFYLLPHLYNSANDGVREVEAAVAENKLLVAELKTYTEEKFAEIKAESDKAYCSYHGTKESDGKCKCEEKYQGGRCDEKAMFSCKDATNHNGILPLQDGSQTFCSSKMDGGWELAFNLATGKKPTLHWGNAFWQQTDGKLGSLDTALSADFKGDIFNKKTDYTEIMMMAHTSGAFISSATYEVLTAKKGKSVSAMFKGGGGQVRTFSFSVLAQLFCIALHMSTSIRGSHIELTLERLTRLQVWTTPQKSKVGQLKQLLIHNNLRSDQPLYGDVFFDYNHALVINKMSGWASGRNYNRLATTFDNKNRGHTFAAIGGEHHHGLGSWITTYEAAPITSYCAVARAYGNTNVYETAGGLEANCRNENPNFQWKAVDFAIFVR